MASFPPAFLVVPTPEEETLVSSTLGKLVYGLPRADDAVFTSQEAADLLWRPFLVEFLLDRDGEEGT